MHVLVFVKHCHALNSACHFAINPLGQIMFDFFFFPSCSVFTKPAFVGLTSSILVASNKLCSVRMCVVLNDRDGTKA